MVPGGIEQGTFHAALISVFCSIFIISRGGGTRTHTPYKDPDFKSGASADSATPPGFGREYSSYSFVSSALQQQSSG